VIFMSVAAGGAGGAVTASILSNSKESAGVFGYRSAFRVAERCKCNNNAAHAQFYVIKARIE
jgi:hypothetical protein